MCRPCPTQAAKCPAAFAAKSFFRIIFLKSISFSQRAVISIASRKKLNDHCFYFSATLRSASFSAARSSSVVDQLVANRTMVWDSSYFSRKLKAICLLNVSICLFSNDLRVDAGDIVALK